MEPDPQIELAALVDGLLRSGVPADHVGQLLVVYAARCFALAGGEARAAAVFRVAADHFAEEATLH